MTTPATRAWWVCMIMLATGISYTLTFGRFDPTVLRQSLIADFALPAMLLATLPRFAGRPHRDARQGALVPVFDAAPSGQT